jgi:hypothetical protein
MLQIDIEIIEHADYGTCLRFCPLELGLGDTGPTLETLEYFINCLEIQIDILRATVKHKIKFNQLVDKNEVLRLVELPEWAGLGGVMFHPEGWEQQMTDQAKTELNKLNTELVELLRATDNAFSLGESTDGLICVRWVEALNFSKFLFKNLSCFIVLEWSRRTQTWRSCWSS